MTRYLLLLLFFMTLTSRVLGLDISLGPGLSTKNALLYLIAGFVLIESAVARNRKLELGIVLVPFVLLVTYALATWLVIVLLLDVPTYSPRETLISLKGKLGDQVLMLLVFFYGITNLKDAIWLGRAMIWVVAGTSIATVLDAWGILEFGTIGDLQEGRVSGVAGGPNPSGGLLAFFLPATIALAVIERGFVRWLAILGAVCTMTVLVMTVSRGALVGAALGSVLAGIYLRRFVSGRSMVKAGAVGLLVCVVVGTTLIVLDFGSFLEDRLSKGSVSDPYTLSSGRTWIWGSALDVMMASPWTFLIGFGWDAYSQSLGHKLSTHSDYVGYLYNLGLIGLVLWLMSMAGAINVARASLDRATRDAAAFLMAVVFGTFALLVSMAFNDMFSISSFAWAFTGIVLRIGLSVESPTRSLSSQGDYRPRSSDAAKRTIRPMSWTPSR